MLAANNGDAALVQLLLKHNAEIDAIIPEGEKQGWTALKIAESEGHEEVIQVLKAAGAK
jgi:ankyrin repeat protein